MRITLRGKREGERIELEPVRAARRPDRAGCEGGFDLVCKLAIDVGCYHVRFDRLYSSTGALRRFGAQLQACYDTLGGAAEYAMIYEKDLVFRIVMRRGGHAVVRGTFRAQPETGTALAFEMETDQSCFPPALAALAELEKAYGITPGT